MLIDEETYAPGQAAGTKRMKMSEAVRIGAAMTKPCKDNLIGPDGGLCAMGAAYYAVTGRIPYGYNNGKRFNNYNSVYEVFPEWGKSNELRERTWVINFEQGREAVADWLEAQGL